MSEEQRQPSLPVFTAREAAQEAGQRIRAPEYDGLDDLHVHCRAFIETAKLTTHARSMALTKCSEMVFWIRAGAKTEE